ncbi:MAG: type II CAAX endopeptidase family protein [Simkaniaceae bacterium]
MTETFSIFTFWHQPGLTLTFLFLAFAMASLWARKTPWAWGLLGGLSFFFAYRSHAVQIETLIPIALLMLCFGALSHPVQRFMRLLLVLTAAILSMVMMLHFMPGFRNWLLSEKMIIGRNSLPYNLYWNFDKGLVGLIILALYHPIAGSQKEWSKILLRVIPLILIGIPAMIFLAHHFQFIDFDPKITWLFLPWAFSNLFFAVIPEEAFYRGFLQKEISDHIPNRFSGLLAILTVSIFFALMHLFFIYSLKYASFAFLAGIIYGIAYQWTKCVEAGILCHFAFNAVHFLFFTYPALQKALN